MKMKLNFLTKLLVGVFLVFCTFAFVGCSDDDDETKPDYGKTGEIPGTYVYQWEEDGITMTNTLVLNKPQNDPEMGTGTIYWYALNSGYTDNIKWQFVYGGQFEICISDGGTAWSCPNATFDGADAITWQGPTYRRKK